MKVIKLTTISLTILTLLSCSVIQEVNKITTITQEEKELMTKRVRNYINDRVKLTKEESKIINSNEPTLSYYVLSGKTSVQYSMTWKLPNKHEIIYQGLGDIKSDNSFKSLQFGKFKQENQY